MTGACGQIRAWLQFTGEFHTFDILTVLLEFPNRNTTKIRVSFKVVLEVSVKINRFIEHNLL